MKRIRYKYRPSKEGVLLKKVKCPICSKIVLLAECWNSNNPKKPSHLFLIELKDLPIVNIQEVK